MNIQADQLSQNNQHSQPLHHFQPPREPEDHALAKEWNKRIASARRHWDKYHRRVKHNRELVAGFDWSRDPNDAKFYKLRANLIQGTISSILPSIYARNPEISVTANHAGRNLKLLCHTIERVTNRQLVEARLKKRAKSTVKAALTCSMGIVKVMYQKDRKNDPVIKSRLQDTQDNLAYVESLLMQCTEQERAGHEAKKLELQEALKALQEQVEVTAAEGMVIDRVLSEHLLIDPAISEFWDYEVADYLIQLIPMRKSTAEGQYGVKLTRAKAYKEANAGQANNSGKIFSGSDAGGDDAMICICEVWDKRSSRVYTLAEGCDFFLREPYSPKKVGERWYPFFILPFQTVDGQFIAPSLVDLSEQLQSEHNDIRDKEAAHRELIKPGYIADATVQEKNIKRFTDSVMGEVTIVDAEGKPVSQVIVPKTHSPMDPMAYDTSKIRYDWEQVTGLQDAARSSVVQPKTATEANIMQQNLSGKVSEFRDQVEDFLQEIAQYTAQMLLMELSEEQVARIMGQHRMGELEVTDPATGRPMWGIVEPAYDWPQLSRDEIFDMVQLQIRAGTTGEPDKLEQQETWLKLLPAVQPLMNQIMQVQANGGDAQAFIFLLKETIIRFDDKLDVDQFIPKPPPPPLPPPPQPALPPAAVMQAGQPVQPEPAQQTAQ